jgi:KaiC/GvpD/RAD55 family RecA-like ATPase
LPQYLKDHGVRLVELGYTVLPIRPGTKRPDLKNWPHHATTVEDVVSWYSNGRAQHGAGINARNTPAIDVDVMDDAVADAMSRAIDRIFPGVALMTRTGLAPKFLIPFRSDEPFRKLTSKVYSDGKHEHKVEILGDGQQWVAFAIHPDTDRPYKWFDGLSDSGISSVPHDALPELDRRSAQLVIDAFEVLAAERVEAGAWVLSSKARLDAGNRKLEAGDDFAAYAQPVRGLARQQLVDLLKKLPLHDRDGWLRAGRVLHHQFEAGEDGFELWVDLSKDSEKFDEADQRRVWESFGHRPDAPETVRSLIKEFGQPAKPRLPNSGFVPAAQFASAQKVEWHIKHVLPKRGLIVVYGDPGSSKSFFALDMVAHVARGLEWRGHRVRQANVAYIVAEGVAGFGNRLAAYASHNGISLSDLPVFVRGGAFELKEDYLLACDEINAIGNVGIVVIDTLAAVTPGGNENTSEDMGAAIDAAQRVIEATGASVILIHHTNSQGALRGWSGLKGAVDNLIRIERKEGLRTAHIEKQKEGAEGPPVGYRLKVVDLYADEDGDPVTSCVVVPDEEVAPNTNGARKERKPRSGDFETSANYGKARHFLRIIQDMCGLETGVSLQEDEVIEAIQKDPEVNPMAEPDYPLKKNIIPTLRTLGHLGKISKEGRNIRLGGPY